MMIQAINGYNGNTCTPKKINKAAKSNVNFKLHMNKAYSKSFYEEVQKDFHNGREVEQTFNKLKDLACTPKLWQLASIEGPAIELLLILHEKDSLKNKLKRFEDFFNKKVGEDTPLALDGYNKEPVITATKGCVLFTHPEPEFKGWELRFGVDNDGDLGYAGGTRLATFYDNGNMKKEVNTICGRSYYTRDGKYNFFKTYLYNVLDNLLGI